MKRLRSLFQTDAAPGVILLLSALLALVLDNSPLAFLYDKLLQAQMTIAVEGFGVDKPLLLWINDGLMAVFFFFVGLEIKKELLTGRLSTVNDALLPALAAAGGMLVPALVYYYFNTGLPSADGWAIPAATDIAFALGVLALLGSRVPVALKVFLLALAIIDDLGAIVIIALFYTSELSTTALLLGGAGAAMLVALNVLGVRRVVPYIIIGIAMWHAVLKSGVHATLSGVVLALIIPLKGGPADEKENPVERLEHGLKPWVAFMVMPIFAFANAGVSLSGLSLESFKEPLALGIMLGLFLGKPLGILACTYLATLTRICSLPKGVTWMQILGVSWLAGIGFTMSLFIGTLAFVDMESATSVRIGVLSGSLLSAITGFWILKNTLSAPKSQ